MHEPAPVHNSLQLHQVDTGLHRHQDVHICMHDPMIWPTCQPMLINVCAADCHTDMASKAAWDARCLLKQLMLLTEVPICLQMGPSPGCLPS